MTTAWVLRGGASFGAAQAGMARALLEAGHHADLLYGTSAGALNATWLAADPTLHGVVTLSGLWTEVERRNVFPLRPWTAVAGLLGLSDHTVSPRALARWLRGVSPLRRLEDGVLPLTVVTTDIESGEEVLLDTGPAVQALLASTAMPGIFPPVRIGDRWLMDGSIASDTPIGPAARAGADRVWVLPSVPAGPMARPKTALDALLGSTSVVLAHRHEDVLRTWSGRCELYVLPAPLVPGTSPFSFGKSRELIASAYQLCSAWLEHPQPACGPPLERLTGAGSTCRVVV
jgi:NTE family protein